MILCRVTGDVVSTVKNEKFQGHRILILQPVELDCRTPLGASFLAMDVVQAGVSDLVLALREGSGVRLIFQDERIPLAAVTVAVVDDLEVEAWEGLVGASTLEHAMAQAGDES